MYNPLIEETIFYVAQSDDVSASQEEAMTLLRFGLDYVAQADGDANRV